MDFDAPDFDTPHSPTPLTEINMVPMIDVMLVLLVIFIITAPLLTQAVKLALPQVGAPSLQPVPQKIEFAINAAGELHWNGQAVSRAQAMQRFQLEAAKQPQPELHLRADQAVAYRVVAQTLADAAKAGLTQVGFISAPDSTTPTIP
jgi:biopolymer transport protein ExbD